MTLFIENSRKHHLIFDVGSAFEGAEDELVEACKHGGMGNGWDVYVHYLPDGFQAHTC